MLGNSENRSTDRGFAEKCAWCVPVRENTIRAGVIGQDTSGETRGRTRQEGREGEGPGEVGEKG